MVMLHSIVDNFNTNIRCHQKEGDALKPRYLNSCN